KIKVANVQESIIVIPSSSLNSAILKSIPNIRTAYCSGWTELESRKSYSGVDTHLSISDHIDFFELIELCKSLNQKHEYITHTPTAEVVKHYLSQHGISSSSLDVTDYGDVMAMNENFNNQTSFYFFATYLGQVADTRRVHEKIKSLT